MTQSITKAQCIALIMMTILPTAIIIVPKTVMNYVAQDAWISLLLSSCGALLFSLALGGFAMRVKGGVPFLKWLSGSTGRWISKGAGLALAVYYYSVTSTSLHEYISFVSAEMLEYTPQIVLKGVVVLVLMYIAAKGIEPIARISFLVMTAFAPLFLLATILLMNRMNWHQILPIADHSLIHMLLGGITPLGWFSEVAVILLIAPHMVRPQDALKGAVWGVLLVSLELTIIVFQALLVFGPNLVKSMEYSTFELVGMIEVGNFIERVEVFFIAFWLSTAFLKLGVFFYGTIHLLETTIGLSFSRLPLLAAVSILLWLDTAFSWPHDMDRNLTTSIDTVVLLVSNLLLPMVLFALYWMMGGSKQSKGGADA